MDQWEGTGVAFRSGMIGVKACFRTDDLQTTRYQQSGNAQAGFTLVEIMIVVAVIALLAAIALPNFMRARKRSQAASILEDLRTIDGAISQYAIENNKMDNSPMAVSDLRSYVKAGTRLYAMSETGVLTDLLGNSYTTYNNIETVSAQIGISRATFNALSDVAPVEFWSPFGVY